MKTFLTLNSLIFLTVRAFDLIPRLWARPSVSYHMALNCHRNWPYTLYGGDFFALINHFLLCAAVVSLSQPQSKWLWSFKGTQKIFFISNLFSSEVLSIVRNKPAALAVGADPSQWSSTNGQNPPFSKIAETFEPVMRFECPSGFKFKKKNVT